MLNYANFTFSVAHLIIREAQLRSSNEREALKNLNEYAYTN